MKVVATSSAQHIINTIKVPVIGYTIKQFNDGELYLKLNQDVRHETVWVIASTQAPAENMLELFSRCFILGIGGLYGRKSA